MIVQATVTYITYTCKAGTPHRFGFNLKFSKNRFQQKVLPGQNPAMTLRRSHVRSAKGEEGYEWQEWSGTWEGLQCWSWSSLLAREFEIDSTANKQTCVNGISFDR